MITTRAMIFTPLKYCVVLPWISPRRPLTPQGPLPLPILPTNRMQPENKEAVRYEPRKGRERTEDGLKISQHYTNNEKNLGEFSTSSKLLSTELL
ncbi:hypothetical protein TNCV_3105991 [Trichonephila clavipes]|nr:hypothetical protein TNCV_3105991 [Trichonephila clavipes]